MRHHSQIYEKCLLEVVSFICALFLLNSCAPKSTRLFDFHYKTGIQVPNVPALSNIEIEKKSVYFLGVFTGGEYDRFESNIYDQLRISLYSEARYKYPNYELTAVQQEETKKFLKTTYTVKGQLVLKKEIKERLDLMTGNFPNSKDKKNFEEFEVVNPKEKDTTSKVLSNKHELYQFDSSLFSSPKLVESKMDIQKHSEDLGQVISERSDKSDFESSDNGKLVIQENQLDTNSNGSKKMSEKLEKLTAQPSTDRANEISANEFVHDSGMTVYIVACFQLDGFVESKILTTEQEIGYPLAYYKTNKWVRVYLNGEFENVIEAKKVFDDAWPIQFGK